MTPKDAIEATAYRVLRNTFVTLTSTSHPSRLSEGQKTAIVGQHQEEFDATFTAICECLRQSRAQGVGMLRKALHSAEQVDHEMLDEKADYALRTVEETEG